jgi:NADH:ubiquinone oxidoreductase subunit 6 (subunit J)
MLTNLLNWLGALLRFLLVDNWPITLVAALGFAAVFLLLPRPRATARTWGAAAGGLALLLAGALVVRATHLAPETVLFYAFAGIAVIAGGLLVTQSNPARAALSFALVVLSTCGLFLLQAAPFLMAATVIIYAGAIIVTFLFVVMLARQEGPSDADQRSREPLLSSLTGFVLLGALLYVLHRGYGTADMDTVLARVQQAEAKATVQEMAEVGGKDPAGVQAFFDSFRGAVLRGGESTETRALAKQVEDLSFEWNDWAAGLKGNDPDEARKVWRQMEEIGLRARASYGALQPAAGTPLSDASGPTAAQALYPPLGPAGGQVPALRRDTYGRPQLPHENTAYLGRSLFTDYLLAVELGGTLLLVATIGAIAIASRRGGTNA